MNENPEQFSLRRDVMDAIRKGRVHMRPRWHFLVASALFAVGIIILVLALLYVSSLGVFFLRDSGVWFAPSFGVRGWFDLLRALPVVLILLGVLFILLLEIMVRRYAFVYRKPLLASIAVIFVLVMLGGFFIGQSSFHRRMADSALHGQLPAFFNVLYGPTLRAPRPPDMYRGIIEEIVPGGFTLVDPDSDATTTVVITPRTRLPYGEDFSVGMEVLVVGDPLGTSSVAAFGVRGITE